MKRAPEDPQAPGWPDGWLVPVLRTAGLLTELDVPRLADTGMPTAWQACVAAGIASDEWILSAVSERFRMPLADVEHTAESSAALLPGDLARRLRVVPLSLRGQVLAVACADPTDIDLERTVAFGAGHRVQLQLAAPGAIEHALERLYPAGCPEAGVQELVQSAGCGPGEGLARELEELLAGGDAAEVAIPELVDALIVRGIRLRASDLHLEPAPQALVARYRVDGVLREAARLSRSLTLPLVSRLKIMANLDIADRLRPQDGRAQAVVDGRRIDLRISSLPVSGLGEKIVVRILDSTASVTRLETLGFDATELHMFQELLEAREGLVLVTGPTGSGKTTTLYAALRTVQSSEVNIVTVEDPIEYRLEGISQVQVNEKAGLTFASTLRSILRQDPDVVLVGEIRDRETADVAIQAALTGHLVLSTLHTNDAASTIMRLVDMGVDVSALATALRGVVAQRLLRRVCPACRQPIGLEQLPVPQQALLADTRLDQLHAAVGCPECAGTGYHGRLAVAEIAHIDAAAQRTIAHGGEIDELIAACQAAGMRTMWESGLRRVASGATTLHELMDNIAAPSAPEAPARVPAGAGVGGAMRQEDIDMLVQRTLRERGGEEPEATGFGGDTTLAAVLEAASEPPGRAFGPRPILAAGAVSLTPPAGRPGGSGEQRPRVLLVDEDAQARRILRDGLAAEGLRVLEASDGETALEYIRRLQPDAVVLELTLPRLDGFGILRAVQEGIAPATACIVLTVQDDEDVAAWASELGAVDYLVKPVTARALAARLYARMDAVAA